LKNEREHTNRLSGNLKLTLVLSAALCCMDLPALAQRSKTDGVSGVDSNKLQSLFYSALSKKTIDDNAGASDLFGQMLQIDPQNDAAMYELASLKKSKNNYNEAQPLLEKAVTIKPDNIWYWSSLADVYEKSNDIGKLENVFTQLIRLDPERIDHYYDKAKRLFFGQ